ncbi:class I SAM-dependent methyltransferase [Candidatus Latescibacterota bacterium]
MMSEQGSASVLSGWAERGSRIGQLVSGVLAENPGHTRFLCESAAGAGDSTWEELESFLGYCTGQGVSLNYLVECYNTIVQDTLVEQVYFMRHKEYRHSTYAEVAEAVYQDPVYMHKYMLGLAISLFLWPAHRKLKDFFASTIPRGTGGRYLEVGPGHGFFFMKAATTTSYDDFLAVDISPKSVEMTRSIMESGCFGEFANYRVECLDFLAADFGSEKYEALVMGEVLEHVENPAAFLQKIRELTHDDSYIYISTCLNAPAVDHISLFTSVEHLESIVEEEGLRIVNRCLVPHLGMTVEECLAMEMAVNFGAVVAHR